MRKGAKLKMKKLRIVFDVDDTISHNPNKLPYSECVPDMVAIEKINQLKRELDCEIILHTSRGMISCSGNIGRIIKKNREVLVNWLKKYNVSYDELIFGKPIADLYVDDKAMHVDDFKEQTFELLHGGGSGKKVIKLGDIVIKDLANDKAMLELKQWQKDGQTILTTDNKDKGKVLYPKVYSWTYNRMYMEYIQNNLPLSDIKNKGSLKYCVDELLRYINMFSTIKVKADGQVYRFNINEHIDILKTNYLKPNTNIKIQTNKHIDNCIRLLRNDNIIMELNDNASFCHGDLILSNVLLSNGDLYLIDSRYQPNASSYLLDYAKLRMSISDYEYTFGLSKVKVTEMGIIEQFDYLLKSKGIYDLVIILQYMYYCRLCKYKSETELYKVLELLERLVSDNEELLKLS